MALIHLTSGFLPPAELKRRREERARQRASEMSGSGRVRTSHSSSRRSNRTESLDMDGTSKSHSNNNHSGRSRRTTGMDGSSNTHVNNSGRSRRTTGMDCSGQSHNNIHNSRSRRSTRTASVEMEESSKSHINESARSHGTIDMDGSNNHIGVSVSRRSTCTAGGEMEASSKSHNNNSGRSRRTSGMDSSSGVSGRQRIQDRSSGRGSRRERTIPILEEENQPPAKEGDETGKVARGVHKSLHHVPEKYYRQGKPPRKRTIGMAPPKEDSSEGDGIFLERYKGTGPIKIGIGRRKEACNPSKRGSFIIRDQSLYRK